MNEIRLNIILDDYEAKSISDFIDEAKHAYGLDDLEIIKPRRKRSGPFPDSSLSTIIFAIATSATAAAIVKCIFDLIREYLRIKFEKEKIRLEADQKRSPLIFRVGDREISIPPYIEEEERNRLLEVVEMGVVKLVGDQSKLAKRRG